jgi:hypothetical protein
MLSDSWPNREDRLEGPSNSRSLRKICRTAIIAFSTATLVEPRTNCFASLNSTKMRLVWGRNDTLPLAVAKIVKVGVALLLIVVVRLEPIDEKNRIGLAEADGERQGRRAGVCRRGDQRRSPRH